MGQGSCCVQRQYRAQESVTVGYEESLMRVGQIDTIATGWAIHTLGGVCTPANSAYSSAEIEHQLRDSKAKCIFTCVTLLDMTVHVAAKVGISKKNIYILELPNEVSEGKKTPKEFRTINDLIKLGGDAPAVEPLKWQKGQGAKQTAYLCYSSGTSGLPKGVMISHRNVIANILQIATFDRHCRKQANEGSGNVLGLLPMSHI